MKLRDRLFEFHSEAFGLDPSEEKLLKLHEPSVEFNVIPYHGLSEGRQSRVSVLEYKIGGESRRVIWKRMAAGKGLDLKEAKSLHSRLMPYRNSLENYGWHVPRLFYTGVVNCTHGAQIFSYEELITGGDGENLIINDEEPNFRKWALIRSVLQVMSEYPQKSVRRSDINEKELTILPHGLDLKLANVVLDEKGKLYFVDLFCPKELDEKGNWLTFSKKLDSLPENNLRIVCASREGSILRFLRLAEIKLMETMSKNRELLRNGFAEIISSINLPKIESDFIISEIMSEYHWLDEVYMERKI